MTEHGWIVLGFICLTVIIPIELIALIILIRRWPFMPRANPPYTQQQRKRRNHD